jgi:hypothetical protein
VQELVRKSLDQGLPLQSVVEADEQVSVHLNREQAARLFSADESLGDAQKMIDRVLARYEESRAHIEMGSV